MEPGLGDCSGDRLAVISSRLLQDRGHCFNADNLKTGQPPKVNPSSKETGGMLKDVNEREEEEDEGFEEDQMPDLTPLSLL
ncbi:hypothetical protein AOLI_G00127770 [Acnodon oligacanthus]